MKSILLAAAAAFTFSAPAAAAELVTNGSFDSAAGVFDGWTHTNNHIHSDTGRNGTLGIAFGANFGSEDTLSQTLATVAGNSYTVSFWLANSGTPDSFSVSFGDQTLLPTTNLPDQVFTFYSYTATASSNATLLSFVGANPPGHAYLDDVSVTDAVAGVPEPATWALMIGGFGLVGGAMRRRASGASVTA